MIEMHKILLDIHVRKNNYVNKNVKKTKRIFLANGADLIDRRETLLKN